MRAKSIILLAFFLPSACLADSIDFYTDGVIQDGNAYNVVRLFDDATVNMTGGVIMTYLELFNTSTFNAYGGSMGGASSIRLFDSSVVNLRKLEVGEAYGWPTTIIELAGEGGTQQINFYGYGFYYDNYGLNGYWSDGSKFIFGIRDAETQSALVFHEVPEPATLLLISLGGLLLRKW